MGHSFPGYFILANNPSCWSQFVFPVKVGRLATREDDFRGPVVVTWPTILDTEGEEKKGETSPHL